MTIDYNILIVNRALLAPLFHCTQLGLSADREDSLEGIL